MTVNEGSMHALQGVYLHPYCLVVTRLDKIHIPALGHTCWHLLTTTCGVYTAGSTNNCVGGRACVWLLLQLCGDGKADFLLCVCVCLWGDRGEREGKGEKGK